MGGSDEGADRFRSLLGERDEARAAKAWPIMVDGPHKPDEHRIWLARQLLDSKLTDEEAYGIVWCSPALDNQRQVDRAAEASLSALRGEVEKVLGEAANTLDASLDADFACWSSPLFNNCRAAAWSVRQSIRSLLSTLKEAP